MADRSGASAAGRNGTGVGDPTRGRWNIVVAAVLVQLALGAVYDCIVFNVP